MAEVKWQARRINDGILVDVTGDTDNIPPQAAPSPNALESGGGVFNGGTITDPLTVDTGLDETQLIVEGITGQNETLIKANLGGVTPGLFVDTYDGQSLITVGTYSTEAGTAGRVVITGEDQGAAGIAKVSVQDDLGTQTCVIQADLLGDLLEATTGGIPRVRINKNGYLIISRIAAPADGDLTAGQMALWFDQTNGAGKLMIKAKTANGTVVTGNVALT